MVRRRHWQRVKAVWSHPLGGGANGALFQWGCWVKFPPSFAWRLEGRAGLVTNEKRRRGNGGGEVTTPPGGRGVRSLICSPRWRDFGTLGFWRWRFAGVLCQPALSPATSRPCWERCLAPSTRSTLPPESRGRAGRGAGTPGSAGGGREGGTPYSFLHFSPVNSGFVKFGRVLF